MNYDKEFFDSPEFRELLARYEQSRKLDMNSYFGVDEFVDILSYYLFIDNKAEAEEVMIASRRFHPSAPENIKMEIKLSLCYNEPERAYELFKGLEFTNDADTLSLKAEIMLALKNFKEARETALTILRQAGPDQDCVYDALEILLDCGFAIEALHICEKALKATPKQRQLLEVKAECLIELQRINQAVDIYNRLLDETPYSTFYWEQLGHVYYMVKKFGKALESFEYENAIDESIEYAGIMQGYCYYHLKDYSKAKEIFTTFARKYDKAVAPQFYLGLISYRCGNIDDALHSFAAAIENAQEGTIEIMLSRINKAMLLDSIGETERAEDAISMALLMHPDNMKQLVLTEKHLYELRDKENLTFDDMNILESKEWTTEDTLYRLGAHLTAHKHFLLAKRVFQYCRDLCYDPTDIDAYIAYILWNTGEKEKSATAIENAINGRSNKLFELFGLIYDAGMSAATFMKLAENRKGTTQK